ncbi:MULTISPECIES: polysaccharide biosynthesis tyrosine autokinase [Moorena]|uniref:Capsular exopolysaccharide family protein n=1 Tax=Moorena producens 3L TaxID=489825 RepID=F4XV38_9CYAN|nr:MULTISPECIES: polysaccharide biosynthesis tyrosine autokinase [Moorena]EGJ31561.1 capsular exopolysaccharide family protein [Moorena producens 3L]NEP67726.1 polysaccharide biosynthesis tyrosine autokinase [Moorena sp. SIO3A5]NEQ06185.1 polysaccharide biosynthesis tyrosine autokinase [Moorena sp. SIO4E2]OLT66133.1 chain-length determining protein [Moorena producens 3L]
MDTSLSSLPLALKRRLLPALVTFTSVIGGAIAYLVVTPPVYQVKARLMLDNKKVSVSELGDNLSQVPANTPGGADPIATQAELVGSERLLQGALDEIALLGSSQEGLTIDTLREDLKVKIVPATNILELSYQGQNPELVTTVLNAVANAMVTESAEGIRSEARAVREFLEKEVPLRRLEVAAAEAALNKFKQTTGLVSPEEQTQLLVRSLATLEDQERAVSIQLQDAKTRSQELQTITSLNNTQNAYIAGRIGQDQELQALRAQLVELDRELAKMRSRLTDQNPAMISLVQERYELLTLYNQKLSRLLPTNQSNNQIIAPGDVASDQLSQDFTSRFILAQTERSALEQKLYLVQTERIKLQNRLGQIPVLRQPFASLVRRQEEAIASLKLLQNKLEEARIAEAQLVSNIQIIERAKLPSSPQEPNPKVVLVIATAAGIALAVGMVLLLEVMDNTLHDASEAEALLKLPRLGVLPKIPAQALSLEQPNRFLEDMRLMEPYRLLLTTMELRAQKRLQLIVVSSAVSGEGKSVVASHLGAVSVRFSRRTLIIDADWRHPMQHNLFGLPPKPKVTDVIDSNQTWRSAVQPTAIANLSILTCSDQPSGSATFLQSQMIKSILAAAADHYDLVIVDTPPVSSFADAHILSRYSDGLVIVTRPNFTQKDILLQTVSELKDSSTPILGFVANGISDRTQQYYFDSFDSYQPQAEFRQTHGKEASNNCAVVSKGVDHADS